MSGVTMIVILPEDHTSLIKLERESPEQRTSLIKLEIESPEQHTSLIELERESPEQHTSLIKLERESPASVSRCDTLRAFNVSLTWDETSRNTAGRQNTPSLFNRKL
jgi:hypothetical protein